MSTSTEPQNTVHAMDRRVAERLMSKFLALDGPLNAATELTDEIPDEEDGRRFRREIAHLALHTYTYLIRPIVRQYPDLDQDR